MIIWYLPDSLDQCDAL